MNPHGHLSLSFFAPLIESVSRNNTAASIDERLEGRQLCQCLGSGVNHSIADTRVCGPMRNQTRMHKPALVSALCRTMTGTSCSFGRRNLLRSDVYNAERTVVGRGPDFSEPGVC